jgi:2-polyprenyl-6-methoxyphenol hydroxylase-like FAD-dependent oxidoreductase
MKQFIMHNAATLKAFDTIDLGDHEDMCGAPHRAYHRGDLHAELLRMARETVSPAEIPVQIFKGVKITRVDVESSTIEVADGTVYSGDLLIGSDGLHSIVRASAIKDDLAPIDTFWQVYRFLLPRQAIMEDEDLR